MAYTLAPYDERQYFDDNGDPLAFGKVNTYYSGTTTPIFTFSAADGTLNTNPVVLSASGRARIYLDPLLSYKFIVTDANDVPVGLTMDPVSLNQATVTSNVFLASTRGTVAAPAFSFVADPDTGIFSSAVNTLDVATSGAQRARVHPTGGVSIGDTTDPGALNVRVAGAVYIIGSAAVTANALENRSGSLYFNNVALATGSSVSGTSGKLAKFTGSSTIGDSIVTESGSTVTVAGTIVATLHSGSGASLTALPAGNLSGTITSATQDLITRLSTIVSGVWNAGALTTSGVLTANGGYSQFTGSSGSPASGAGIELRGGATPGWLTFDRTGAAYLPGTFDGLSHTWSLSGVAKMVLAAIGLSLGGTNITDAVATPTVASHDGTNVTLSGKTYAFRALINSSGSVVTTFTVNFGQTFANVPSCVVSRASVFDRVGLVASTTQVVVTAEGGFADNEVVHIHVRGF